RASATDATTMTNAAASAILIEDLRLSRCLRCPRRATTETAEHAETGACDRPATRAAATEKAAQSQTADDDGLCCGGFFRRHAGWLRQPAVARARFCCHAVFAVGPATAAAAGSSPRSLRPPRFAFPSLTG